MDRFDLEEAIASLWNLSDDINLICDTLSKEGYVEDKILNGLVGVAELNDMRVQRVMDIFENLIHNGVIGNEKCYSNLTLETPIDFAKEEERRTKFCKIKAGKTTCQNSTCQKNSI